MYHFYKILNPIKNKNIEKQKNARNKPKSNYYHNSAPFITPYTIFLSNPWKAGIIIPVLKRRQAHMKSQLRAINLFNKQNILIYPP